MPFIGTQPEVGGYSVLDALTASATASYTLQKDSANFSPSSANQLLVSLNGVIQKPGTSFTVSGSTLTFSSALTSSDSIDFILAMGEPLLVGTPSDGAVNTTQLATNAVSSAKIASSAVTDAKIAGMAASKLTGALPALNGSALTNLLNANSHYAFRQLDSQYFTSSTTRLNFYSSGDNFSSGITIDESNDRFTPTVAGKYLVMYHIHSTHSGGSFTLSTFLRLNGGNKYANNHLINYGGGFNQSLFGQAIFNMNGSSDYVDLAANHNGGGNATSGTAGYLFIVHINAS